MLRCIMSQRAPIDPARLAEHTRAIRQDVLRMIAPFGQGYVQQGLGAAELFATTQDVYLLLDDTPERRKLIQDGRETQSGLHAGRQDLLRRRLVAALGRRVRGRGVW